MATVTKSYTFKVVIEPDNFPDGREAFMASIPALRDQGAVTWGYTREEALKNAQEVAELVVEDMVANGEKIPADVAVSAEPLVSVTV